MFGSTQGELRGKEQWLHKRLSQTCLWIINGVVKIKKNYDQLNGDEFEQTLGDSGGQRSLVCCSVQFIHSVVSNCLWPHEQQHARPPCPSPTLRVHPNPCPLSQWCHPTISSSVIPFSSHLQSFPASGSFQTSQFFASGGQSLRVSASTRAINSEWRIIL